jgi:hypothetical protein
MITAYGPQGLTYPNGEPAAGDLVTVKKPNGQAATLFKDAAGQIPLPNPVPTDDYGNLFFFANPGTYVLKFSEMSIPITVQVHPDEEVAEVPGGQASSYTHVQTAPASLVLINHGIPNWKPAGVMCIDTLGSVNEFEYIAYPASGIVEITFGADFSGTIYLS